MCGLLAVSRIFNIKIMRVDFDRAISRCAGVLMAPSLTHAFFIFQKYLLSAEPSLCRERPGEGDYGFYF